MFAGGVLSRAHVRAGGRGAEGLRESNDFVPARGGRLACSGRFVCSAHLMHRAGFWRREDKQNAVGLYQRTMDGGHVGAAFFLGRAYALGFGVEKDERRALGLYERARDGGHVDASFSLGVAYAQGLAKRNQGFVLPTLPSLVTRYSMCRS